MVPSKLACLLNGFHQGTYTTFFNVFFISIGLSKFQAGIITGSMFAAPILTGPLWGYIADRSRKPKLVLVALCVGACALVFPLPWVAHSIHAVQSNESFVELHGNSANQSLTDLHRKPALTLFGVQLTLVVIGSIFLVPINSYIAALVMKVVKSTPGNVSFGVQTVFASAGVGICNLITGEAADNYISDLSVYTPTFYIFLAATLLLIPVGCFLIEQIERNSTQVGISNNTAERMHVKVVHHLIQFHVVFFILTVFIAGAGNFVFLNFTYTLVTDIMKRSKIEMSYIVVTAMVANIVFLPFTSKFIELVGGSINALIITLLANFVRFLVMSLDVHFNVLVAIQLLNALSFGLAFAAIVPHTHHTSPEDITMTIHGIVLAIFIPVSSLVVGFVGGKVFELYGGRKFFLGASLLCLTWALLMIIYRGVEKVKQVCQSKGKTADQQPPIQIGIDAPAGVIEVDEDIRSRTPQP